MTRRTITPAAKAQNALDVVTRQLDRARARRDKAKTEHDAAQADVTALEKRRDYLASDPDLPAEIRVTGRDLLGIAQQTTAATSVDTSTR